MTPVIDAMSRARQMTMRDTMMMVKSLKPGLRVPTGSFLPLTLLAPRLPGTPGLLPPAGRPGRPSLPPGGPPFLAPGLPAGPLPAATLQAGAPFAGALLAGAPFAGAFLAGAPFAVTSLAGESLG